MCGDPKVSVVVPVFNVGKYLGESLESLLRQTLEEIEIVCVDDGSTDSSAAALADFAARDARVKVLTQANAGAGAARNAGLEAAQGEYVFFCDPDDWCEKRMLAAMYRCAKREDCDVVLAGALRHDTVCGVPYAAYPTRRLLAMKHPFAGRDAADFIFSDAKANPWNKLVRREFLSAHGIRFQEQLRENDLYFSYATVAAAARIGIVDGAYYHYRIGRPGSLQDNVRSDGSPLLWLNAFAAVKERLRREGMLDVFSLGLLRILAGTGCRNMLKQHSPDAISAHYAVLRREIVEFSSMCGERAASLGEGERAIIGIVLSSESPLPLATHMARRYQALSVGRGSSSTTALVRRAARMLHGVVSVARGRR
jgi:glycosyltransferase involved in cell wall biosynthesis